MQQEFIQNKFSIHSLKHTIKEELFSPGILMYKKELVNEFLKKINIKEDKIENKDTPLSKFARDIYTYELDRVKYYLKRYLRIRNKKIEKHILYIFQNDLNMLLSKAEYVYAVTYYKMINKQFNSSFFQFIKNKKFGEYFFFNNVSEKEKVNPFQIPIVSSPNQNKYVFAYFKEHYENLAFERGVTMSIEKGDILFVSFKYIKNIIDRGKAILI